MKQESAEALALQALDWLAQDRDLMSEFLANTGADPGDLVRNAADLGLLASVLDFLLEADARVIGFCDSQGIARSAPMQARAMLPGGLPTHWT